MNVQTHDELKGKIWEIANRLRGPYRPPQYRLVMLPMVVLRRLDCVLEPTRDAVLAEKAKLEAREMPEAAMDRLLGKAADPNRKHPLYNTSPYTFERLLGDAENIAPNLAAYINGFSPTARSIFERFKFADQIEKLDPQPHPAAALGLVTWKLAPPRFSTKSTAEPRTRSMLTGSTTSVTPLSRVLISSSSGVPSSNL